MRITDLPELSVADLAENDVVVVDHDTGNGIETRKFRVSQALVKKMDITNTLESTTKGTKFYYTIPEGYAVLNITLETVYWIGSVYATGIEKTSFMVFCAAVGGEPATTGAYTTTAHISIYKTFG